MYSPPHPWNFNLVFSSINIYIYIYTNNKYLLKERIKLDVNMYVIKPFSAIVHILLMKPFSIEFYSNEVSMDALWVSPLLTAHMLAWTLLPIVPWLLSCDRASPRQIPTKLHR